MAMSGGSVSVAADGTHSGTGLAKRLMDRLVAADKTGIFNPAGGTQAAKAKQELADFVNAIGPAIIDEVKTADVTVTTTTTVSAGGLQRTPNPNSADTATTAPLAPIDLAGSGTGTIA